MHKNQYAIGIHLCNAYFYFFIYFFISTYEFDRYRNSSEKNPVFWRTEKDLGFDRPTERGTWYWLRLSGCLRFHSASLGLSWDLIVSLYVKLLIILTFLTSPIALLSLPLALVISTYIQDLDVRCFPFLVYYFLHQLADAACERNWSVSSWFGILLTRFGGFNDYNFSPCGWHRAFSKDCF